MLPLPLPRPPFPSLPSPPLPSPFLIIELATAVIFSDTKSFKVMYH